MSQDRVSQTWSRPLAPPEKLPQRADVVIIGGGIVGVSTAWFLARRGISVVLCEKGHIACEQSGRNWGWVRIQGRDVREIPMMQDSLGIWANLAGMTGEDVGFRRGGCTFTARNEHDLAELEDWLQLARRFDIDTRLVTATEARDIAGGDAGADWVGGIHTASDGRAEPHKAAPAIARAAVRCGASILTACAVRGVETSAGAVSAVVTEHGPIQCSTVLCAAGAWTSYFCRSLGIDVPQLRVKGTVARTAPAPELFSGNIFDDGIGIRRREDGGYTIAHGGVLEHPVTPASFRWLWKFLPALRQEYKLVKLRFGKDFVDELRAAASWPLDQPTRFEAVRVLDPKPASRVLRDLEKNLARVFPALAGTPVVETWAGMIEASPDVVPIIDSIDSLRGFHIATGFSGHGFGIGPGAGNAIAALLAGEEPSVDLGGFRLARFFDGSPIQPNVSI